MKNMRFGPFATLLGKKPLTSVAATQQICEVEGEGLD